MSNLTRTIEKYIHELFESEGDESIVSLRRRILSACLMVESRCAI